MKIPTLLLHGALGAATQFDGLIRFFSSEEPVFALDFPGHGAQTTDGAFSLSLFSGSVLKFMDDHNIARANLFGYSMGGYVALHLASTHPERIRHVATYGTKMSWSPETAEQMNKMFDPEKIEAKVPQFARALESTHADWKSTCYKTAAFLQDLGNGKGIDWPAFSFIACPVSVGWGSEDNVVTEAESRHAAGLIPHGTFVELNGAKHQIELVDQHLLFKFVEKALYPPATHGAG